MKPLHVMSITLLIIAVSLGCSKKTPTQPDPPTLVEVNDCEIPQDFAQQLYDQACEVCRNHMYRPETAVFRPLSESYVAVTSEELLMVVSTVTGADQNGQEVTSGFVATFQIYSDRPMIYSFLSWKWENRPVFKGVSTW